MARDLQLELRDSADNSYTFDFEGALKIDLETNYNESSEPMQLSRIIEKWTITGARIVGADVATTWTQFNSFMALLEDRDSSPFTRARVIRAPEGVRAVERTLGGAAQQQFQIESVTFGDESETDLAPATWRTVVPVNMVLVAIRAFPTGVGFAGSGIVRWEQLQRFTYRNGLAEIEWETFIDVGEDATSTALAQARIHAVIPIADYGSTYTFQTNGADGFDYEFLDSDNRTDPDRVPARIRVISRIKQWGIAVGTPTAGNSVNDVLLEIEVINEEGQSQKTTRASADGPGAFTWVSDQQPGGVPIKRSRTLDAQARRHAEAEWVQESLLEPDQPRINIEAVLSGGGQDFEYIPRGGGRSPIEVGGPLREFRLVVTVKSESIGPDLGREDMRFPVLLGPPWRLLPNESTEDPVPKLVKRGDDPEFNEWERGARLVYATVGEPTVPEIKALTNPTIPPTLLSYAI